MKKNKLELELIQIAHCLHLLSFCDNSWVLNAKAMHVPFIMHNMVYESVICPLKFEINLV